MLDDFKHNFGLVSKGNEVCFANGIGFNRTGFVKASISMFSMIV